MIRRIAGATALALLAALPHATAPQAAQAGLPLFGFPKKSKPPVVLLAKMIDDLEESLNDTGTIVAKKPDVWGESRLTKHREQVEEQLKEQLETFQPVLSGLSAMTDQAFLANFLAIQAAIGPQGRIPTWTNPGYQFTPPNGTTVTFANAPVANSVITTDDKPVTVTNSEGGPTIVGTAPGGFPLSSALRGDINTDTGEGNLGFAASGKLTLEPTVRVDQLKRYLDHLNELRRLNEGGDTADAPGYSLNLVRIPVSVMPGDDTRKGHGAEITVTAEMHLTRELLPTTFRSMVVQDLMDQLALPIVKLSDVAAARRAAMSEYLTAKEMHKKALEKSHTKNDEMDAMRSERTTLDNDIASLNQSHGQLLMHLHQMKSATVIDFTSLTCDLVEISKITGRHESWNDVILSILAAIIDCSDAPYKEYYIAVRSVFVMPKTEEYPTLIAKLNSAATILNANLHSEGRKKAIESAKVLLEEAIPELQAVSPILATTMVENDLKGETFPVGNADIVGKLTNSLKLDASRQEQDLENISTALSSFENLMTPRPPVVVRRDNDHGHPLAPLDRQYHSASPRADGFAPKLGLESLAGDKTPERSRIAALLKQKNRLITKVENVEEAIHVLSDEDNQTKVDGLFGKLRSKEIVGDVNKDAVQTVRRDIAEIHKATEMVRSELSSGIQEQLNDLNRDLGVAQNAAEEARKAVDALEKNVAALGQNVQAMASALRPGSPTRRSRLPIPPTQIACVFGENELLEIANRFQMATDNNCTEARLSEARAFLKEELEAAYDYLKTPAAQFCWERVPEIAMAVRTGNEGELARLRLDVVSGLCASTSPVPGVIDGHCSPATCGILALMAWPILVEAALLDQRLNEDLQRVSQDPECECMVTGPQCFYLPDPPEEARMAFMDYVRCRWPIHVFALDPQTQDQNVAQASSIRRELQLAAALAFASGRVGASNTLRFVRRLELEEQAIALNRTAIAFAHGANTFGWRFRPRFQTMDIESNAVTVGRDLLWGGPNRDARMKNWRIEPGMRECVALVVMPSFVPHVRFDVRSHWFKLHNHDNIKGEMTDTMKLSSKIAEAQQLMEFCHLEAENYRPGEIERLHARVKQLSDRLPLQTLFAQVPYENTAGGFELFSSGVTDLGPELLDFYGAPGVSRSKPTTLFLVGRNFSVHNSVVIAGNRTCEKSLLSRDVMQVTIPAGSQTVFCSREGKVSDDPCAKCRGVGPCGAGCYEAVEIHLATPYGVSGQLFVPVYQEVPVAPSPEPAGPSPEEITADAVDAAKKLVQGHQAVFHPVTYAWSKPAVKATYLLDTCGRPSDLCLHVDSLAVVPSGATPFGPHQSLSFAASVEAVDSKGKVVAYQSSIAPSLVSMANSTFPLYAASGVAGPHFAAQLATVVANEPELTLQASKLRVHGFVQIGDPTLPPVQLTNVLEIEIGARSLGGVGVAPCPTCPSGAATGAASVPIGENVGHVNLPAANSASLSVSEAFVRGESGSVTSLTLPSKPAETRVFSTTSLETPTTRSTPISGLSKAFLPPDMEAPKIMEGPRFE